MRDIAFVIGKKKVSSWVPESWAELSERQFMAIVGRTYNLISDDQFYEWFYNISPEVVKGIDIYHFYVLNSLLSFTRKPARMDSFFISQMTLGANKENAIVVRSPKAQLAGMSFQQFMMIDTFFAWYVQLKERKFLLSMCSCFYLQEKEDFFEMDFDERIERWAQCSELELKTMLVQWSFIKEWLSSSYHYLFPAGGETMNKGKDGKVKVSNAWLDIFDTLVADDLSRIETYKRLECMDVLRIVNGKIKSSKLRL